MSNPGLFQELTDDMKNYLTTSYEINKLEVIGRSSIIGSKLISSLIISLLIFMFLFFISLWAGLLISAHFGDNFSGFTFVAGFYFLVASILILGRKKFLQNPIRDKIIRETLNPTPQS